MAVSSLTGDLPVGFGSSAKNDLSTELTEFVLDSSCAQVSIRNQNPFCQLAEQTPVGSYTCDQGCGLRDVLQDKIHVCPYGMIMCRVPDAEDHPAKATWLGRRFPSVIAMHQAFDEMIKAGFDQDQILGNLPSNPVFSTSELNMARNGKKRNVPAGEIQADGAMPSEGRLDHLIEFVSQMHNLVATSRSITQACERFLKALSGTLPFDEMSIYVKKRRGHEYLLNSRPETGTWSIVRLEGKAASLPAGSLGSLALAKGELLVEIGGRIGVLDTPFTGCGDMAIPLMAPDNNVGGVWIARRRVEYKGGILGSEWLTLMKLLARLIATSLEALDSARDKRDNPAESAGADVWGTRDLCRVLEPEIFRASRNQQKLALLVVSIASKMKVELRHGEFTTEIKGKLRLYDHVGLLSCKSGCWAVLLPDTDREEARGVAGRLVKQLQDLLDAGGGMEERGLSVNAGISIFGCDAADLEELIRNAKAAAASPPSVSVDDPVRIFPG